MVADRMTDAATDKREIEAPDVRTAGALPASRKHERSRIENDIDELGFAFIRALRERGHVVHGVCFEVWKTPKVLAAEPFHCISVPRMEVGTQ